MGTDSFLKSLGYVYVCMHTHAYVHIWVLVQVLCYMEARG